MPATPASQNTRRVLVLSAGMDAGGGLADWLRPPLEVRTARNTDELLTILAGEEIDLIVAEAGTLSPLLQPAEPWRGAAILEQLDQGVCVFDAEDGVVWTNATLRAEPPAVLEAVRGACAQYLSAATSDVARRPPRHQTITPIREKAFELILAPLLDSRRRAAVALVRDITSVRRTQERMAAIDAAGRALVELDAEALPEMDVGERLVLLQDRIVRFSHDLLNFDHFAIRILDRKTNKLETALASGFSEQAKSMEIYASERGQGITGYVAATGKSYICDDVAGDPRYLPGLESARSSLTVPLILNDEVIGTFNVESEKSAAFTDEDRQFAEILARYLAIALHILRLLVVERRSTSGQIAASVDAEIAEPMREVVTQLTALIAAQPADAPLRAQLQAVLAKVERLDAGIHAVTRSTGVSGLAPEVSERDPLLADKRVLVADDEDIIRETISDVLSRKGAITVPAKDGNEAVALLAAQRFDLVLSDIKMPNKNGYEVFAAARAGRTECPVILITGFGYDPNHSIVRASREGLAGVLFKPFKVAQLLESVRQALSPAAAK